MGSRFYSRRPGGRFRRATLENTFGLSAPVCPSCRRLNPHAVNEPPPENCHACGAAMQSKSTCRKCSLPITLLGGDWTCAEGDMYGLTNCGADLSAPYTPHEPVEA
jgi:hypothetical protein